MHDPLVSVVMAAHNAEAYICEAVNSILSQTLTDFEFIIIDDGSTDKTGEILDSYTYLDKRVKIFFQPKNGLVSSLNRGCQIARGEFIARMDADDISAPNRFSKQVEFLKLNPHFGLLGTQIQVINEKGDYLYQLHKPISTNLIRWSLFFGSGFAHPSVMMRRSLLQEAGFYNSEAKHAEDYDLWCRLSLLTHMANLPEVLLYYRKHGESVSKLHSDTQRETGLKILEKYITSLLNERIDIHGLSEHFTLLAGGYCYDGEQILRETQLIVKLCRTFIDQLSLQDNECQEVLFDAVKKIQTIAWANIKHHRKNSVIAFANSIALDWKLSLSNILRKLKVRECVRLNT